MKRVIGVSVATVGLVLAACQGTAKDVTAGAAGAAGAKGATALVTVTEVGTAPGCAASAVRIDSGVDNGAGAYAGDGVLEAEEIASTQCICKAVAGPAGTSGEAGAPCNRPHRSGRIGRDLRGARSAPLRSQITRRTWACDSSRA
jgi:hypothetical protein